MPHSTRLPYAPCSPHGSEASQVSCTRASPAAEVTNDLGELPWRLEGREPCEGMPDSPARSFSNWGRQSPTLHGTGDANNLDFNWWNKLPGSHQRRFRDAQNLVGGGGRCPFVPPHVKGGTPPSLISPRGIN